MVGFDLGISHRHEADSAHKTTAACDLTTDGSGHGSTATSASKACRCRGNFGATDRQEADFEHRKLSNEVPTENSVVVHHIAADLPWMPADTIRKDQNMETHKVFLRHGKRLDEYRGGAT